jgi:hypothetical protein
LVGQRLERFPRSFQNAPLIRGLDKFGNVLGRNLVFERRGADGELDCLPQLAQELVESKIDVTAASEMLHWW